MRWNMETKLIGKGKVEFQLFNINSDTGKETEYIVCNKFPEELVDNPSILEDFDVVRVGNEFHGPRYESVVVPCYPSKLKRWSKVDYCRPTTEAFYRNLGDFCSYFQYIGSPVIEIDSEVNHFKCDKFEVYLFRRYNRIGCITLHLYNSDSWGFERNGISINNDGSYLDYDGISLDNREWPLMVMYLSTKQEAISIYHEISTALSQVEGV